MSATCKKTSETFFCKYYSSLVRNSNSSTPNNTVARRQTLTGIRTTPQHSVRRAPLQASKTIDVSRQSEATTNQVEQCSTSHSKAKNHERETNLLKKESESKSSSFTDKDRTRAFEINKEKKENGVSSTNRKSKRLEGRRHLTIGNLFL